MTDNAWGLAGKTVVVTGASSGIGAATARFIGAMGAHVVLQGRDHARLAAVASEVENGGGKAHVAVVDLEDATASAALVADTVAAFGEIDGLVLNASLFEPVPLDQVTLESLNRQWSTNVVSHYAITQAAVPHLKQGSSVVFVSSTTSHVGFSGCTAYGATKGAIEALGRTLAVELAPHRIRVNVVAPGFIRTPMLQPHLDANEGYEQFLIERTPTGRLGLPEEVGATIAFLLSDLAPYINGSTITLDGGWTAQ
jgi:NAD(P)-dependent dehydrogenase (short-subunit alcohol dehydrogenase family)